MSPLSEDRYVADRAKGAMQGTHPRLLPDGGAELILEPDDTLEGIGDFVETEANGDPVGWRLGRPENPVARNLYAGRSRDSMVRVLHRSVGRKRPSVTLDFPLPEQGASPPNADTPRLAKIPRPEKPRLKKKAARISGLPASTPQSPHWYAWARRRDGRLTTAGTPVSFHGDYGQSYRVPIPEDMREEGGEWALLVAEPGTSTPSRPGKMWVQRTIDLDRYFLDYYDLTQFRRETPAATTNQTELPRPPAPKVRRASASVAARVGAFGGKITFTDENGESLPSSGYDEVTIARDSGYTRLGEPDESGKREVEVLAGRGYVEVTRPPAPPTATGWRLYLYYVPVEGSGGSAGWNRAVDRFSGQGGAKPFPISRKTVRTAGWTGSEEPYGNNDRVILEQAELPTENTSGLKAPEGIPEPPEATGVSRPAPGPLFVCTTDVLETGAESLPSPVASVDLGTDDVPVVAFVDPANRYANTAFVETDPDELPLHWRVDKTGGDARVIDEDFVLWTNGAQAGITPSTDPEPDEADPAKESVLTGEVVVEDPEQGVRAGSVEVVWRQFDAAGTAYDTVLLTADLPGEYRYERVVAPSTSTASGLRWRPDVVSHTTVHRFSGGPNAIKNLRARIRRALHRRHRHGIYGDLRRRIRRRRHLLRDLLLERANPPGFDTSWQEPPEPPWSPETRSIPYPDRMPVAGVVEESLDFEGGLAPLSSAGWSQNLTGSAALSATAAAAISGSLGLRINKPSGGVLSSGYYSKTSSPAPGFGVGDGRHDGAFYKRYRFPTLPVNGEIVVKRLCRPSDGAWFAELRASSASELVELVLLEDPTNTGNVSVSLAGVLTQIPVNSTPEVSRLEITSAPTRPGVATVNVMGTGYQFIAGGESEVVRLDVKGRASTGGYVVLNLGGSPYRFYVGTRPTAAQIAEKIRGGSFPGWHTSRTGATVWFTADLPGPRTDATLSPGTTRLPFAISTPVQGSSESRDDFVTRIRSVVYQDATAEAGTDASGNPLPNVVVFRARTGGSRPDSTYSPGTTGAVGAMSTTTQGAVDTKEQVAARMRATTFSGWAVSGAGSTVRFEHTQAGVRQQSTYNPGQTGCSGQMKTLRQGTGADITLRVRQSDGSIEQRRMMAGLLPTTIANLDLSHGGAGTERGVVNAWGSFGGAALDLIGRFEDLDLTAYPGGIKQFGVIEESSASLTWEVHIDDVRITDKGLNGFDEHDAKGRWLGQVVGSYHPDQPVRQGLLLQQHDEDGEERGSVIVPGRTYVLAAQARADNPTNVPARLAVAYAVSTRGELIEVADATRGGVLGVVGWTDHVSVPYVAPRDCYKVIIESRDIGAGEYVIQRVVNSPGTVPKRTGRYATAGTYEATYDLRTPNPYPGVHWGQQRRRLGALVRGAGVSVGYRSAPLPAGPFSESSPDPALAPEGDVVRVAFALSGDGSGTPAVLAGSPFCEYLHLSDPTTPVPMLLTAQRGELPGGTVFYELEEWAPMPAEGRTRLPSGRLRDDPTLFPKFGDLPPSVLYLFTSEARNYFRSNWKDLWVIEAHGEAITVKLSGPPAIERTYASIPYAGGRERHALYVAKIPACEVVGVVPIA